MWVPAIACTILPTRQDPKTDNKENSRAVSVYYEEQNLLGFLRITIVTRFIGIENMDANSTTTISHKLFQTHHLPPHTGDFLSSASAPAPATDSIIP